MLKIIPLGGLGEIGKNMMLLESEQRIIIIDCGLMFPTHDMHGIDIVIPDIAYLRDKREQVTAFVITHAHEDHIGALPYVLPEFPGVPVYASTLARGLISNKIKERRLRNNPLEALEPGDTVLGMSLDHGGHLTHGSPVNVSGKWFEVASYGVGRETGTIDMDEVAAKARESKPKIIIAGGSAYARYWDFARFREIADEVGAYLFVDMAHVAGLVAAGLYPSPIPHADVCTTTTHKTLRGPRGGLILARRNDGLTKKFNSLVFPGTQGGPLMHVIAAKAVAFKEAMEPGFVDYQAQVIRNAQAMAQVFMDLGYDVVSKGTDDHLFLVSFIEAGLTGGDAIGGRIDHPEREEQVPQLLTDEPPGIDAEVGGGLAFTGLADGDVVPEIGCQLEPRPDDGEASGSRDTAA